jgi:hypothetical protein
MATPYIPSTDSALASWATNFDSIVAVDFAALGVTAPEAAAITAATSAYNSALVLATDPGTRTPVTVQAKNTAKADLLGLVRPIAQRIAINPAIDDMDKVDLGLNPRGTVPTPVAPPTTFPVVDLLAATPGQIKIQYRDSETPDSKAKPYGVVQMEVWVAVASAPVVDPALAVYFGPATKSPHFVDFEPASAGDVATFFCRWRNRNGGVGPWSSPVSMIVV